MEFRKTLSEILEQQIRLKHKSILQFSQKANIPYMTVSGVIKRGVENTTVGTLQKICNALGITITDLFRLQALDTIQYNLQKTDYTDDDLISDLQECNLVNVQRLSQEKRKTIINNYRFFFTEDWI